MGISPGLLNEGEQVVLSTRTHVKVLLGAVLVLVATVFLGAFTAAWVSTLDDGLPRTIAWVGLGLTAAGLLGRFVLDPFLRWYTTTYTFTDRRFIQRSGLIAREGRTIPLNRIAGVDFDMGVVDRLFGCGTLVVSDASEGGAVPLHDIPRVEEAQRIVAEQLHRTTGGHRDREHDGT